MCTKGLVGRRLRFWCSFLRGCIFVIVQSRQASLPRNSKKEGGHFKRTDVTAGHVSISPFAAGDLAPVNPLSFASV